MQLDLLATLPDNGMSLLLDTLTHWHTNARLLQTMIGWWLEHHPTTELTTLAPTFSQNLYDVLMIQRNKRWQQQLEQLPPDATLSPSARCIYTVKGIYRNY